MTQARDIYGNVFTHGSITLMARLPGNRATLLTPADIREIRMSVLLLDAYAPEKSTFLRGYRDIPVSAIEVMFPTLQIDARWQSDEEGYNFLHTLTNENGRIFTQPNRHYLVIYKLTPAADAEKHAVITLRFRLYAI